MHYYLVPYIGTGVPFLDPFRPEALDGASGSIDLRPDASVVDGFALLAREIREDRPTRTYLGDDLDTPSPIVHTRLGNLLGVTLTASGVRQMIAELLLLHGDATGRTRWRPLQPTGSQYVIYLGKKIYEYPVLRGGTSYYESFDKPDAATLGPDLPWDESVAADWEVVSKQAKIVGVTGWGQVQRDTAGVDQFAQVTGVTFDVFAVLAVLLRSVIVSSTNFTAYAWNANLQGSGTVNEHAWAKWVAGTETYPIGTISTEDTANGELLRGEIRGSTLSGFKNGVLLKEITDTSIQTGTRSGLRGVELAGTLIADAFSFGDLRVWAGPIGPIIAPPFFSAIR